MQSPIARLSPSTCGSASQNTVMPSQPLARWNTKALLVSLRSRPQPLARSLRSSLTDVVAPRLCSACPSLNDVEHDCCKMKTFAVQAILTVPMADIFPRMHYFLSHLSCPLWHPILHARARQTFARKRSQSSSSQKDDSRNVFPRARNPSICTSSFVAFSDMATVLASSASSCIKTS